MRRLLALLGASAMIGLALLVRGLLDDDGDDGSPRRGDELVIVCTDGLELACEALRDPGEIRTRVEAPATTLAALADGSFDADAWVAPAPWVAVGRAREGSPLGTPSPAVARAPVTVLLAERAAAPLAAACGGDVTWRCLGDLAETEISGVASRFELGIADPETGVGLAVLGAAGSGFFGTAGFAANDFDDPGFDAWLGGLTANAEEIADDPRPLTTIFLTERGHFTAIATVSGARPQEVADAGLAAVYPAPVATADVVVAPVRDRLDDEDARRLAADDELVAALVPSGATTLTRQLAAWRTADDTTLPKASNQPRGGVLAALLDRWREAR